MRQSPDGQLELFYSANRLETASYAIGWAKCQSPAGPCQRASAGPIIASNAARAGPGGPTIFTDITGQMYLAFHAWTPPFIGYPQGARRLYISRLSFVNGAPIISA